MVEEIMQKNSGCYISAEQGKPEGTTPKRIQELRDPRVFVNHLIEVEGQVEKVVISKQDPLCFFKLKKKILHGNQDELL